MAWTAPATWSVAEIVTAAKMNTHIRDNLDYLKGNAGPVTVSDELTTALAAGGSLIVQGTNNSSFARIKLLSKDSGGTTIDWRILASGFGLNEFGVFEGATNRLYLAPGGNLGINNTAPQGRLHVGGAGGGFLFLSANAVDGTLQTLAAAGTVTQSAAFWGYGRNNTGGGFSAMSGNMLGLGGAFNFPAGLTDTVTVTVTGGGAITVQRTAGTNATHQINMLVLYK